MKIINKQAVSNNCFICGINNPVGLKMQFYETEEGEVISSFTTREEYQSYANRLHGGIITAILDETIGRSIKILEEDTNGVTIEISVHFKRPVPINKELLVVGRITENSKMMFEGSAEIMDGDKVLATAHGKYMKIPIEEITGIDNPHNEWVKNELTYEEIRSFDDKF